MKRSGESAQKYHKNQANSESAELSESGLHLAIPCRTTPTAPAGKITMGSGIFFVNIRMARVISPMSTVGRSTRERRAGMEVAPEIARTAAAETPGRSASTRRFGARGRTG